MSLKKEGRYNTVGLEEGEFEPGSHHQVLKNLLGIKKKREMDLIEFTSLEVTQNKLIDQFEQDHRFTAKDICQIHELWLGKIYAWAGKYRQVNMAKGGFPFAAATQIPLLMGKFEKEQLKKFTPCHFVKHNEICEALAITHVELVLIHPFREGNGRIARLLSTLMALQAKLPLLDFGGIKGKKRQAYFAAVRAGMDCNYEPMKKIFDSIIRRTLKCVPVENEVCA